MNYRTPQHSFGEVNVRSEKLTASTGTASNRTRTGPVNFAKQAELLQIGLDATRIVFLLNSSYIHASALCML